MVILYTDGSPECASTVEFLRQNQITFDEVDAQSHPEPFRFVGAKQTPLVCLSRTVWWQGHKPLLLQQLLGASHV